MPIEATCSSGAIAGADTLCGFGTEATSAGGPTNDTEAVNEDKGNADFAKSSQVQEDNYKESLGNPPETRKAGFQLDTRILQRAREPGMAYLLTGP